MKDYIELAKQNGLYSALIEFETDLLNEFAGWKQNEVAIKLKLERTTLVAKIKKLNLQNIFKRREKSK